jgi:hypothetical protein
LKKSKLLEINIDDIEHESVSNKSQSLTSRSSEDIHSNVQAKLPLIMGEKIKVQSGLGTPEER